MDGITHIAEVKAAVSADISSAPGLPGSRAWEAPRVGRSVFPPSRPPHPPLAVSTGTRQAREVIYLLGGWKAI